MSARIAVLGEVVIELLTLSEGLDWRTGTDFAEHAMLGGKPRLQHVGDRLDECTFRLKLHHAICQPSAALSRLQDARLAKTPLPFVLGNGDFKGWFVLTEVQAVHEQTDATGLLLAATVTVTLREHVAQPGERRAAPTAVAVRRPGQPLAAQLERVGTNAGSAGPLSGARQAVGTAMNAARIGLAAYQVASRVFNAAKSFGNNPIGAVSSLGGLTPQLATVGAAMGTVSESLAPLGALIAGAAPAIQQASQVAVHANNARSIVNGVTLANLPAALPALDGLLTGVGAGLDAAGPMLSRIAAHVTVRLPGGGL